MASATFIADVVWFVMAFYYVRKTLVPEGNWPALESWLIGGPTMATVLWVSRPLIWKAQLLLALPPYFAVQMLFGRLSRRAFRSEAMTD